MKQSSQCCSVLAQPTLSIINMCQGGYHLRTTIPLGTAATTNFWSLYGLREIQQVMHPLESWILCVALLCLHTIMQVNRILNTAWCMPCAQRNGMHETARLGSVYNMDLHKMSSTEWQTLKVASNKMKHSHTAVM